MQNTIDRRQLALLAALAATGLTSKARADAAPTQAPPGPDGSHDFDFLFGHWQVHHRRLAAPLANSTDWVEFDGTSFGQPLLGGVANVDDNVMHAPHGVRRGASVRSYDPATQTWAIWWVNTVTPHDLGTPTIGCFQNGVGDFFSDDTYQNRPIKVRYRWSAITPTSAHWDMAYSPDAGATWETNWSMQFTRAA